MTTSEKESETLSLRLSKADKAMLDELVEAKRQELAPLGATTSLAQYVRGWIRSTHAAMVAKRQATPPDTVPLPGTALAGPAVLQVFSPISAAPTPPAKTTKAAPTEADVRRKLKASKRSQAELGRLTGIDAAMLSRFANGKKPLSPEKLARLADELG